MPGRCLAIAIVAAVSGFAQPGGHVAAADDPIVTTHHQITVAGRRLGYTARAGLLPIRVNETGEVHGRMFFVAYLLDRQPNDAPRPLTFLWNGGPGSNSSLVHLAAFGPRRIKSADGPGSAPACDCEVEDNQTTWLDRSDLVFVDPIGTGFSRPARSEYAGEFYNTLGDIVATTDFIRVYRTRFDAWDAPVFLAGESFGVWRAAGVAEAMAQRGRGVTGVILISGGMALGPVGTEEMRTALFVPTRTASAFFHKRLAPDLQSDMRLTLEQSENWAGGEYAAALARRDTLTAEERRTVVAGLARWTGLDPGRIDEKTLVVPRQQFAEELLRDRSLVLGRFDTRQTGAGQTATARQRNALVNRYLRSVLQFKTDLAYEGAEQGYNPVGRAGRSVNARWDYNVPAGQTPQSTRENDGPPGGQPWLRRAMLLAPGLRAFVAAGQYDSLNGCAVNRYILRTLESPLAGRITAACYDGGHMMYEDRGAREQLKRDVDRFYASALGR